MPILHDSARKTGRGRSLIAGMYLILIVGALGTVYPFLLMLSGSLKSELDFRTFELIPPYLFDETALFKKFLYERYGGQLDWFESSTRYLEKDGRPPYSFETIRVPDPAESDIGLDAWLRFLDETSAEWPVSFLQLGHAFGFRTIPEVAFLYIQRLRREFPDASRRDLPMRIPIERWTERAYQPPRGPYARVYFELRASLPRRYFIPTSLSGVFVTRYLAATYGRDTGSLERINHAWGTSYASWADIQLPSRAPEHPGFRADWWTFVRDFVPARFIRFDAERLSDFHRFLQSRYRDVRALREAHGKNYSDWSDVSFPIHDATGAELADAEAFVAWLGSPDGIALDGPEFRWRDWLARNGVDPNQAAHARMPILEYEAHLLRLHRAEILRDLLTRNYRIVWDYLAGHGRAFANTIIYCLLAVATALIVNPMAAYALSRYQPRWGYKVLFFLMATMAFPAEVTQIPAFLMLRELGWLNTFAALVVPTAANGYSIFLLKGFFDSLPRDLYESAELDGAGEIRMFFSITVPLSAPILAVIALGAFQAAYGAFLFALLVCQDESMWTVMVHIYQLQQFFGTPVVFASLVLAAIPTLLVFVLCQKIILRGIVIPVER